MANMGYAEDYLKVVQGTFKGFCYYAYNGGKKEGDELAWIPSKFHTFLCDQIQEFVNKKTDKAFEILVINTPPQHGKSVTCTESFPAFYLMRNPDNKVIVVSYGDDLAERFGKRNLEKIENFGKLFGVKLNKKKATSRELEIAGHSGRMISKGFGSGITGQQADLIVIDDPVKNAKEADSQVYRDSKWEEFDFTIKSRLSAGGKVVLIMTRWHEDDLAGRILDEYADRTTLINLPCEAEENDLLGREVGDALCPEIGKGNEWLKDFKRTYSSEQGLRAWNALYQGRPTAKEGNVLKREWWKFYKRKDYDDGLLRFDQLVMSVDASFKDSEKNDFVAIEMWGKKGINIYLLDVINRHLDFPSTVRRIRQLKAQYPLTSAILIEDKANGSAIIQTLRNEVMGIVPVSPDASKEARVQAVTFAIEAGNVYLPDDVDFVWEFIDQCASFPNAKHDDMVDSMSQALARLIFTSSFKRKFDKVNIGNVFTFSNIRKKPVDPAGKGSKIRRI